MNQHIGIRRQASRILGRAISPNGWMKTFQELDKDGQIDMKTVLQLVMVLCQLMDSYEKYLPKEATQAVI